MSYESILDQAQKRLKELAPPGCFAYLEKHPRGARWIGQAAMRYRMAIEKKDKREFDIGLERYVKGWERIFTYMALDHIKERDPLDVDHRFFRHLPSGYRMVIETKEDGDIVIFPQEPTRAQVKNLPPNTRWLTSSMLIHNADNSLVPKFMKEFGARFARDGEEFEKIHQAAKAEARALKEQNGAKTGDAVCPKHQKKFKKSGQNEFLL